MIRAEISMTGAVRRAKTAATIGAILGSLSDCPGIVLGSSVFADDKMNVSF